MLPGLVALGLVLIALLGLGFSHLFAKGLSIRHGLITLGFVGLVAFGLGRTIGLEVWAVVLVGFGAGVVLARRREKMAQSPVVERVIERQVLVMHCPYCKELTPVDLTECKNCGAKVK